MDTKDLLLNSKLCFGPMSKNIVDSLIKYSNEMKTPLTFIPSRRQIEWNGGYVNGWTTEGFVKYVKKQSKYVVIQRDHGGPGQGSKDDDGLESLTYDCQYLDSIHIDPWKKYPKLEDGIKYTVDLLKYCHSRNPNMYYEIGTEEAIRPFTYQEIDIILSEVRKGVKAELYDRILFCVIQSGTALKDGVNTGDYNNKRLLSMIQVTEKYGKKSKEHNGDYMADDIMKSRFNSGLSSLNIAPELGVFETKIILKDLVNNKRHSEIEAFYNLCYNSGKWIKWVSKDFKPEDNRRILIEICGHYVFSERNFNKIKSDTIDKVILKQLLQYIKGKYMCAIKY